MWKKRDLCDLWSANCKVAVNEKVGVGRSMSLAVGADAKILLSSHSLIYTFTQRGTHPSNILLTISNN